MGGAYEARSVIANAQRCINLYPETNPRDAPVPVTHYQRPGLRKLVQGPFNPVRGLYRASNGNGYAVIGAGVYFITPGWELSQVGNLVQKTDNPVSFTDNGIDIMLVDGSSMGFQIHMTDNTFSQINDPTGLFTGADKVDVIDTFILSNVRGTNQFISTLSNEIQWDATYVAGKTDYPDPLQSLIVNRHEILLMGALKSEIWYDAGNPLFPFAELPGAYIEHGMVSKYALASCDISVFWLGQDLQGHGFVFMQRGYETRRISTHALEYAIQKYPRLDDVRAYSYQQGGHNFIVFCFPSGDATWVYDESNSLWHQRAWTDQNGVLHRDRTNCHAFMYGTNVAGDWENGTLYKLDPQYWVDDLPNLTSPISCIRAFPHLAAADIEAAPPGRLIQTDGKRLRLNWFEADIECGNGPPQAPDGSTPAPLIYCRVSLDRGRTFGNAVQQTLGFQGEYLTYPIWRAMGLCRDPIFELSYSAPFEASLNGGWIEAEVLAT